MIEREKYVINSGPRKPFISIVVDNGSFEGYSPKADDGPVLGISIGEAEIVKDQYVFDSLVRFSHGGHTPRVSPLYQGPPAAAYVALFFISLIKSNANCPNPLHVSIPAGTDAV